MDFDILLTNPPFAGQIKDRAILRNYKLAEKGDGKMVSTRSRDVLFIERCLNFLKKGGRMAIVLPQGRLTNITDDYVRSFIMKKARILAVVGLDGNTFKPHAGTKTSVLFLQKWDDTLCPYKEDYPIFFAVSENSGKDSSGEYIFKKDADGSPMIDKHGHLIVEHDLDEITNQFIEFAKREKLSFWR